MAGCFSSFRCHRKHGRGCTQLKRSIIRCGSGRGHDNNGRGDDHLLPFDGGIDWAAALMATQKIGYDGTLMFEVAAAPSVLAVLDRTRYVRTRFEELLT